MTTLAEAFESFQHSAWRLEARDTYLIAEYDDQLKAFLAGQPMPPRADGWAEVVQAATTRGARIGRIRLVGHPITDYTRFEFALYTENVQFGEDVRIVDRTWLDGSWATAPDVWLFDDQLAFRQQYSDEGAYLGAERIDAGPVREMRQVLSTYAVPVAEYRLTEVLAPRPESAIPTALPRAFPHLK
jgi:Family of unknown function (DUF6879)